MNYITVVDGHAQQGFAFLSRLSEGQLDKLARILADLLRWAEERKEKPEAAQTE